MQVMTAGSGASGSGRIEVARALRARVRRQRAELGVGRRDLVDQQHLGVAPGDAQAAAEQLQLSRRVGGDRGLRDGARRERVVERRVIVVVARRQERVRRAGGRERVGRRTGRLEVGQERIGRAWPGRAGVLAGRRRRPEPGQARRLRAAVGVLPVVARAVVEAWVGAGRHPSNVARSVTSRIRIAAHLADSVGQRQSLPYGWSPTSRRPAANRSSE